MADKPDMTGMADTGQLRKLAYKPGTFYLGSAHPDHGWSGEIGLINPADGKGDDRHVFIVAGSRSGKGTSLIIPNLLRWPGPVFCIDPKGENASITAMRRARPEDGKGTGTTVHQYLGQRVAILDPFSQVQGPACTKRLKYAYDPLTDIDPTSPAGPGHIESLVESLVITERDGEHWCEGAATILAGTIEMVLLTENPDRHTLPRCREHILQGMAGLYERLLNTPKTRAGLAAAAVDLLEAAGDNEAGSFKTTLIRQMRWLGDPRMQDHLTRSEFSLRRAVREGWSVYVVLPPALMPRMKRWLRAIVGIALDVKMENLFHEGPQTLFLLDEFPILGHFQIIEDASGYMAGYGIKLVPVIQNIGQLRKHYGQNWETFMGNAGAILAWGLNDRETEQYIADRIGPVMVWETSYGASSSGKDKSDPSREGESATTSLRERPIRWPSEIRQQGAREHMRAFVVPASAAPFTIRRQAYMKDDGKGLFDSPTDIREWEKRYAQHT